MKKWMAFILAALLVLSMSACGNTSAQSADAQAADAAAQAESKLGDIVGGLNSLVGGGSAQTPADPIPEGEPSAGPVQGVVGGCPVTILGAEQTKDDDGAPVIRFYFELTNATDSLACALSPDTVSDDAGQGGASLEMALVAHSVEEEYNQFLYITPGKTIRAADTFYFDPEGGPVGFRLYAGDGSGDALVYYADPKQLSGPPSEPFVVEPDPDAADFVKGMPSENDCVTIGDCDFETDPSGNRVICIWFTFTNNTAEVMSFWPSYSTWGLQDGYTLRESFDGELGAEVSDLDDVEPGQTVTISDSFVLTSDSPVAFVVEDLYGGLIGKSFPVQP